MRKAFTVVEVIVTFVILSILIFFAIYSFRFSMSQVKHATYYLPKQAMTFSALDKILGGIYYFVIEKEPKEFVFYFKADAQTIEFITTSPLYEKQIALAKLEYKDNTLFYTEEKLYHKAYNFDKPAFTPNPKTVILMEQLENFELAYVSREGETLSNFEEQIPKGIIMKFSTKGENYHLIFAPLSDFQHHKTEVYDEKYPI